MSTLNLSIPLRQRLANRKAGKPYLNVSSGMDTGTLRNRKVAWFDSIDKLRSAWRFVGYADKVVRLDHSGWYADNYHDELCRGIVVQIPAHEHQALYLAGFECSASVCIILSCFNNQEDAAIDADREAELYAEGEREYRARDAAEMQIKELTDENKELLADIHALRAERIAVRACGHKLAADGLLQENYWEAVPD